MKIYLLFLVSIYLLAGYCTPKGISKRQGGTCVPNDRYCKCTPKGKCKRQGGTCVLNDRYCQGGTMPGRCGDCTCCIACKPSKKCKRANGECKDIVNEPWTCRNKRIIENACKPKTGCKINEKVCCAPCTKPKGECKEKGGHCSGKDWYTRGSCSGQIIAKGCKGCECCIPWSYTGYVGPKKWSTVYTECSGRDQSPVNLGLDVDNLNLTDIIFNNYEDIINQDGSETEDLFKPSAYVTENQLFYIDMNYNANLSIEGGGIEPSILRIIAFKWGSDSSTGSEHTINNRRYPMEMQLGHMHAVYATDSFLGFKFLYLSTLFEISETDNKALDSIIQAASVMADQEGLSRTVTVENLQLSSLLPSNTQQFYRYQGSMTYPPCYTKHQIDANQWIDHGTVQWTVFTHTSTISEKQLNVLRSIEINGKSISNNYRPLQPINGRPIFLN